MSLFPAAGGGPITNGSLSALYVFVDRRANPNVAAVPVAVSNRIALVKGSGTFAQIANSIAPFQPAAILIITTVENATALQVIGGVPTYTIGPGDGNYLEDQMITGHVGSETNDVPVGTISELPLRIASSAALSAFQPGMAGLASA